MAVASSSSVPPEELNNWENIASEMGWGPEDCLAHKLSFKGRVDPAKKVDTLAAHVKRLRAVGWYMYAAQEKAAEEAASTAAALAAERTARAVDQRQHEEAEAVAQAEAEGLKDKVSAAEAEASRRDADLKAVRSQLAETKNALEGVEAERVKVAAELEREVAAAAALQQKLTTAESTAAESQKYSVQLQEYNSKMQTDLSAAQETVARLQEEKAALAEECAALRGRVAALGDALEALQAANASSDAARQNALEEAGRLRADLAAAAAERAAFASEASMLRAERDEQRKDLERFRAATGKDLAALEAEKASKAALATRTEAQAATVTALQEQVTMLRAQRAAAEGQAESKTNEVRALSARVAQLETLLAAAEERARESEAVRRRLHNTILELKGNVRVFCRVRPTAGSSAEESAAPQSLAVSLPEQGDMAGRALELEAPAAGNATGKPTTQRMAFTFDRVFGPGAGQEEVFEEVSALVQSALDGYRVCIFAYGQTGSGKTHTMLGREGEEGIVPRAVRQVFATADAAKAQGWKYEMRAAMLEIYNEEIRDLLGKGPPAGKKHLVSSEDTGGAASVSYLEWVDVGESGRVASLLKRAMSQRAVGATASNEQSSRSHMVFMLSIEGSNEATGQRMAGALNLVDLAGSERLAKSCAAGDRLKETQSINKSLSALGDVISALGAREKHVPFRNSKLTHLLQSSLSGAGKALMLCNINPAAEAAPESLCTLRFAAKVNATELGTARRNVK